MKKWKDIRSKLVGPEQLAAIDEWVANESVKINLQKIREIAGVTQERMAKVLNLSQSALSRMERSRDPKLSTLRRHVEALGGKVEVHAVFDDKSVKLGL